MCEFCKEENAGNGITLDGITSDFGNSNLDVDLTMWYGCENGSSLDVLVTVGSETIASITTKIKFCPMCGRELRSEENE